MHACGQGVEPLADSADMITKHGRSPPGGLQDIAKRKRCILFRWPGCPRLKFPWSLLHPALALISKYSSPDGVSCNRVLHRFLLCDYHVADTKLSGADEAVNNTDIVPMQLRFGLWVTIEISDQVYPLDRLGI